MHRIVLLRAFSWFLLGSLSVALLALIQRNWFGAGDLRPFIIVSTLYAGIIAAMGPVIFRLLSQRPPWLRYFAGGLLGFGVGTLLTIVNRLSLGLWFGAWSIPVGLCWAVGGALALMAASGTPTRMTLPYLAREGIAFSLLLVLSYFGVPLLLDTATGKQELTVVVARWYEYDTALIVDDKMNLLKNGDREALRASGIRGRIETRGGSVVDRRHSLKKARMLILVKAPVDNSVKLYQPDATNVVYIQQSNGFTRFPVRAKTINRTVEIYPEVTRPDNIGIWIELTSGARSGGEKFMGRGFRRP